MKAIAPESLTESLNEIISTCIHGPGGDPDRCHMRAAAKAFVLLRRMGLPIHGEEDYEDQLRKCNASEVDFLAEEGLPE